MNELIQYLETIFTRDQQTALLIITFGVMSLVQVFKNVYFGFYPVHSKIRKRAILWLAAFTFGAAGGVAGYYVGRPPQPLWFWMFVGIASGGAAIGIFKIVIEIDWRTLISGWLSRK